MIRMVTIKLITKSYKEYLEPTRIIPTYSHLEIIGKIDSNGRRTILSGQRKTRLFDLRAGTSLVLKNLQLSFGCVGNSFTTFQHPPEMKCRSSGSGSWARLPTDVANSRSGAEVVQ